MDDPPAYLAQAADQWGTPLYVTDLDIAATRLTAYRTALPDALIAYALKANPDPQLLRRFAAEGAGAEVVSAVELALARRAGIPPERIVMNGVGTRDEELHLALGAGVLVNAESLDELDALSAMAADHPQARIGLRLNPALDVATHPHLATGAASAKFGIPIDRLRSALARLTDAGLGLACLGAHIGSAVASVQPYLELVDRLAAAVSIAEGIGLEPEAVDLGGGLAEGETTALAALAEAARRLPARLIVEPGRSLVADAGWLVTRVVRTQPRPSVGCGYLVADGGMTELIRPVLYGADHPVSLLRPGAAFTPTGATHLAGPICEAGDVLARDLDRWLTPAELAVAGTGALLAIGRAGAYGAAMAFGYNGRLRAAEVVVEGGVPRLSRRRETLDDLLSRDV